MRKIHLSRVHTAGAAALAIAALAVAGAPVRAEPAATPHTPHPPVIITLATAEQALKVCHDHKMGDREIAYFAAQQYMAGYAQWGPHYHCMQSRVSSQSGPVTKAIQSDGTIVTLVSKEEAHKACKAGEVGDWDVAYIKGNYGLAQWGPAYKCKQARVPYKSSSVTNALAQ
ncbi:hypothetical protein [Azospirillum sp. B4]|uniref:hypothetical protein n=1 Tax=Azospirillum sp. B4 TaxID=95605 RepID=UPI00034B25FB|nr:hypothetical protein [Azospirillum sp. B4]